MKSHKHCKDCGEEIINPLHTKDCNTYTCNLYNLRICEDCVFKRGMNTL